MHIVNRKVSKLLNEYFTIRFSLDNLHIIVYIEKMNAIKQTVEIPANRRLTIEVPHEVPTGKTILSFKPVAKADNFSIKKLRGTL